MFTSQNIYLCTKMPENICITFSILNALMSVESVVQRSVENIAIYIRIMIDQANMSAMGKVQISGNH